MTWWFPRGESVHFGVKRDLGGTLVTTALTAIVANVFAAAEAPGQTGAINRPFPTNDSHAHACPVHGRLPNTAWRGTRKLSERLDERTDEWPLRPWFMAALGAAGGLIFHLLTGRHAYAESVPIWRQAAATFVAVATVSFLVTVEKRRWLWAAGFAAAWGAVIALVGWFTARYNFHPTIFEWPYLSGLFAVMLAAPLFQTIRDEGAWRFPYARVHRHAWTDGVIGAASLVFTGMTFLLSWLIASLFDVIGIDLIKDLMRKEWFDWVLAGLAFGGVLGLLRERDGLAGALQRLVTVVLAVLAPVLAVALVAFLASLPFKGLSGLWNSYIPVTPLLLVSAGGAFVLANDVIGDGGEDRIPNVWLRRSALVLVLCILPLAFLAVLSMGQRVGQYGWTPERIWGVVAAAAAGIYGLLAWWSVFRGRMAFDDYLRPLQVKFALGLCGLALFLALPIVDFGAISASSQLERLQSGKVTPDKFDWTAMAFDFGQSGRRHLAEIETSGPPAQRELAKTALRSTDRYLVTTDIETTTTAAEIDKWMRVLPDGATVDPALRAEVVKNPTCNGKSCVLLLLSPKEALLIGHPYGAQRMVATRFVAQDKGGWSEIPESGEYWPDNQADPRSTPVEVRTVTRRQLFVDGKRVGGPLPEAP